MQKISFFYHKFFTPIQQIEFSYRKTFSNLIKKLNVIRYQNFSPL